MGQRTQPLLPVVSLWWNCLGNEEEGGDDVKSVLLLHSGLEACYNGRYSEKRNREMEPIFKTGLSSDWSLQFDSMKLESLVIGGQLYAGEYVLGSCTHCPSRQQSWGHPKSHFEWAQGGISDEGEVVNRNVATYGSNSIKKFG